MRGLGLLVGLLVFGRHLCEIKNRKEHYLQSQGGHGFRARGCLQSTKVIISKASINNVSKLYLKRIMANLLFSQFNNFIVRLLRACLKQF